MNTIERRSRLAAALESLGKLRALAVDGEPVNSVAYAAAIAVAGTAADADGLAGLRSIVPATKATLDDLDLATAYLAELLREVQIDPGDKATKAWIVRDMAAESQAYNAQAAGNLRWIIESEDRAAKAQAQKAQEDEWVAEWLDHGRRRIAKIRRAAVAGWSLR